jgi:hypothetical protein
MRIDKPEVIMVRCVDCCTFLPGSISALGCIDSHTHTAATTCVKQFPTSGFTYFMPENN